MSNTNREEEELANIWQEMDEALAEIRAEEGPLPVPDPQEHEAFMDAMFDVAWTNFIQANPDWNPLDDLIYEDDEEEPEDGDDEEDEDWPLRLEQELKRRKKVPDSCSSCKVEAWKSPGGNGDDPPPSASAPLLV